MNIHIVCRNPEDDMIIPRLYRAMVERVGWTISREPRDNADLNLFSTYIEYGEYFPQYDATPTAAYFSHYETDNKNKMLWWDLAVQKIDLALCTAPMFGRQLEALDRNVAMVTPFVDRTLYDIQGRSGWVEQQIVGVSGFVSPTSKRKGEQLVGNLAASQNPRMQDIVWKGSGAGWPVKTKSYSYTDRPGFYNSLSLFFCSSSVEGIPITVLEALACGVPVLIPRNVGMLDELPDVFGIWRYDVGAPVGDMEDIILQALDLEFGRHNRDELRAATEPYVIAAWIASHLNPIENLLYELPPPESESKHWKTQGNSGIYMVAFGQLARECAVTALESASEHIPAVGRVYVSDTEIKGANGKFLHLPDADIGGRQAKLSIYDVAPQEWNYVLYLDADTKIMESPHFLFEVLRDGWDMVICFNQDKYATTRNMHRPDYKAEVEHTLELLGYDDLLQYNGGVFAFRRSERTKEFFDTWLAEWKIWKGRDQAALLRALHKAPLRVYVLGNHWNNIDRYGIIEDAVIRHYPMTARRWDGLITEGLDSKQAWDRVKQWERRRGINK